MPLCCLASVPPRMHVWKVLRDIEFCWASRRSLRRPIFAGPDESSRIISRCSVSWIWKPSCYGLYRVSCIALEGLFYQNPPPMMNAYFRFEEIIAIIDCLCTIFPSPATGCRSVLKICNKRMLLSLIIVFGFWLEFPLLWVFGFVFIWSFVIYLFIFCYCN